jgi:hypothetical protein
MRLPGVSFALAAGLLFQISPLAGLAAAHGPSAPAGCLCRGEAETSEFSTPAPARPAPVPTPLDARGLAVAGAYGAVFRILSAENGCSRFFGGPAGAVEAFNQLARRLSIRPLGDRTVAIRMAGQFAHYRNSTTGAAYRLFDEATVNLNGPFGPDAGRPAAPRMWVGRFPAHTRQGQALILLHELGHLVRGPDGDWLLPNDGFDHALSARNTRTVEAHCVEQLRGVRD